MAAGEFVCTAIMLMIGCRLHSCLLVTSCGLPTARARQGFPTGCGACLGGHIGASLFLKEVFAKKKRWQQVSF